MAMNRKRLRDALIVLISCGVGFNVAFMCFVRTSFSEVGDISLLRLGADNAIQSSISKHSGIAMEQDPMTRTSKDSTTPDMNIVSYEPAAIEKAIMDNLVNWGWDKASQKVPGCDIWTDSSNGVNIGKLYEPLKLFRSELKEYYKEIKKFQPEVANVKEEIIKASSTITKNRQEVVEASVATKEDICKTLRLHPDGLLGLFPSLSLSHTSTSGYIEPLTTPMRHPDFCFNTSDKAALMDLEYLIHDFEAMCLTIQPTSRMILIDSLWVHHYLTTKRQKSRQRFHPLLICSTYMKNSDSILIIYMALK